MNRPQSRPRNKRHTAKQTVRDLIASRTIYWGQPDKELYQIIQKHNIPGSRKQMLRAVRLVLYHRDITWSTIQSLRTDHQTAKRILRDYRHVDEHVSLQQFAKYFQEADKLPAPGHSRNEDYQIWRDLQFTGLTLQQARTACNLEPAWVISSVLKWATHQQTSPQEYLEILRLITLTGNTRIHLWARRGQANWWPTARDLPTAWRERFIFALSAINSIELALAISSQASNPGEAREWAAGAAVFNEVL